MHFQQDNVSYTKQTCLLKHFKIVHFVHLFYIKLLHLLHDLNAQLYLKEIFKVHHQHVSVQVYCNAHFENLKTFEIL